MSMVEQQGLVKERTPASGHEADRAEIRKTRHPLGVVPDLAPMLAERSLPPGDLQGWSTEPKLDGWRVTVGVSSGWVGVRTRRGRDVTGAIPGIQALATGRHRLLLDGELVAGAGRASDFYDLMARVAGRPR